MLSVRRLLNAGTGSIAVSLLLIVLTPFLLGSLPVYAIPSSNLLEVPYYAQEEDFFCGPASVQMGIEYVSGDVIPQRTLAAEMKTVPVNGTYTNMMRMPFGNRGYTSVSEAHTTLDELKEQNSRGYVSIILIWSDTDHKYGHYVVVIGYNATGIFVNDPWPVHWNQPESRKTGKDAFISSSLLADLWTKFNHWVLEILYPAHKPPVYTVMISVSGLPQDYRSRIVIDGVDSSWIRIGEQRSFDFKVGTICSISVDQYISGPEGTRYYCSSNSWSVSSSDKHSFVYTTQYYLNVSSNYGTVSGSSWYDAGSMATFLVTPTEQPMPGLLGLLGGKYIFDHWSSRHTTSAVKIRMESPQRVTAIWREDLTFVYLIVALGLCGVIIVVVLSVRRRRAVAKVLVQPQVPIYPKKYCTNCGAELPLEVEFCLKCGARQS